MAKVVVDRLWRWASVAVVCAASLALSGCLITNLSGSTVNGLTTVQGTAQLLQQSSCVADQVAQTTTCTPTMQVQASGVTQTFQFLIKLLGLAIPLHLYDPLIVQVPASMSNFAGSITIGPPGVAPDTPLSIISGLTSVPVDAHTNLLAEPGMQLVIIDFQAPDNAPFGTYTLKLQFSGTTDSIKVMFAAKITAGPTAYYVPIFPCVTNFASVPAIGLPVQSVNGVIQLILSAQACTGLKSYDFSGISTPPPGVELNQQGLTGSWFEPATSGQGFELEVFPNLSAPGTGRTFVSWFTFDSVVGGADRQRWYTLQGDMVNGQPTSSLTIYQNTGGNFNAPPITTSNAVGTATLSFDSCISGVLTYTFTDGSGRAGSIPLTRLTQNVTCSTTSARPTNADFGFSGNWFDPATSGQGFTIEVNPTSGALFYAWYTYAPNGAGAGAAGQRWYTGLVQGIAPGTRSFPIQIRETTGGRFDAPTVPEPGTVPVGNGTLTFQSCTSATFDYNFTGGTSSGASGTIALSRVGPVPPGCL